MVRLHDTATRDRGLSAVDDKSLVGSCEPFAVHLKLGYVPAQALKLIEGGLGTSADLGGAPRCCVGTHDVELRLDDETRGLGTSHAVRDHRSRLPALREDFAQPVSVKAESAKRCPQGRSGCAGA